MRFLATWTVLVCARAVKTQSCNMAPTQTGLHGDQGIRESHGHSMIVDPSGRIPAQVGEGPGVALAEIDTGLVSRIRQSMPVHQHRRPVREK